MSINRFKDTFSRMYRNSTYRLWLWVMGFFTVLVTFIKYKVLKGKDQFSAIKAELRKELEATDLQDELYQAALRQVKKKNEYFNKTVSDADALVPKKLEKVLGGLI